MDITLGTGRMCPIEYSYSPRVFNRVAEIRADVIYVIGGLYGNRYALDAIEAMALAEPVMPTLIFNGDFHWFDADPARFVEVQSRVLKRVALRGNVETELAAGRADDGCGCAYPPDVSDAEVARSNLIMRELFAACRDSGALLEGMAALPMHAVAQVGDSRIGIVHGDCWSLAGWRFGCGEVDTPDTQASLAEAFRAAEVDGFASSHTCLPLLRRLMVDERLRFVINNGAAGMPNFSADLAGLITRIGVTPSAHAGMYGLRLRDTFVDALPVRFDHGAFVRWFESRWPPETPAHASYYKRITDGPHYSIASAMPR